MAIASQTLSIFAAVLGTALAMLAWSEFVFFNEEPAEKLIETLTQGVQPFMDYMFGMVLFYLIPSAFLVSLVSLFGSGGLGRIMVIGALTGYSIEGAVVPQVYEAVPFSYLWTSVAWHGPITVGLGVFLLPQLLARASVAKMIAASVLLGTLWGLWTTWTWGTHYAPPVPSFEFSLFAASTAAVLLVGYGLCHAAGWPRIAVPRWISVLLCLPTLLFWLIQGSQVPFSALGLLIIVAGLTWVLHLWGPDLEAGYQIRRGNVALLALMPAVAGLVYATLLETGAPLATEDLLSLMFMLGMITWLFGIGHEIRRRRKATQR